MTKIQPETVRLQLVRDKVSQLYLQSTKKGVWMWENHVQFVANKAAELAARFGINKEKSVIGALLHDLGDIWVPRKDENHDSISKKESKIILQQAGFNDAEINEILDEIIAPHSCHPGNIPRTPEGKILATADALAHLATDFYLKMQQMGWPEHIPADKFSEWAREKIARDFHAKIFFDEVREEVRHRYEQLKAKYS